MPMRSEYLVLSKILEFLGTKNRQILPSLVERMMWNSMITLQHDENRVFPKTSDLTTSNKKEIKLNMVCKLYFKGYEKRASPTLNQLGFNNFKYQFISNENLIHKLYHSRKLVSGLQCTPTSSFCQYYSVNHKLFE